MSFTRRADRLLGVCSADADGVTRHRTHPASTFDPTELLPSFYSDNRLPAHALRDISLQVVVVETPFHVLLLLLLLCPPVVPRFVATSVFGVRVVDFFNPLRPFATSTVRHFDRSPLRPFDTSTLRPLPFISTFYVLRSTFYVLRSTPTSTLHVLPSTLFIKTWTFNSVQSLHSVSAIGVRHSTFFNDIRR